MMIKNLKSVLGLLFVGITFVSSAQDAAEAPKATADTVKWERGFQSTLNASQVNLTNWSAGGENSLSATGSFNMYLNRKYKRSEWVNELKTAYGIIKQGDNKTVKSDDILDILSKYGYKTNGKWYYSALFNLKSQFDKGFKDPQTEEEIVSAFLAPGYVNFSLGMDYKPNKNFSLFLSPLSTKTTMVLDDDVDETQYGLDSAKTTRIELGANLSMSYRTTLMENVDYETRVNLYSNYLEQPFNVDVNWMNLLTMKVNKFLNVNILTELIYDDNINIKDKDDPEDSVGGPKTQFKEVISLGLTYKWDKK